MGLFTECKYVIDLGCGNGRNSEYLHALNIPVKSFDRFPDYNKCIEYQMIDPLNIKDHIVDGILFNYVLMFLNDEEYSNVLREMNRVSIKGCILMVEVAIIKTSYCTDKYILKSIKNRFIIKA